jgi:hypothetical protein
MAKAQNTPTNKVEAAAEQPKQPSHTDKRSPSPTEYNAQGGDERRIAANGGCQSSQLHSPFRVV